MKIILKVSLVIFLYIIIHTTIQHIKNKRTKSESEQEFKDTSIYSDDFAETV